MNTPNDENMNEPNNVGPPLQDELDALLRIWHEDNAQRAAEIRESLLATIGEENCNNSLEPGGANCVKTDEGSEGRAASAGKSRRGLVRRIIMNRYSPIAAVLVLLAVSIPLFMPGTTSESLARDIIQIPEAGRLDALDDGGNVIGPCPLKHTDVDVDISGHFSRVTLVQQYHNPYEHKIEAVYTFPLSHRAAVDRMTMTIGNRVVVGEVKEREKARAIYEAAREQGYVASLLEQERPNIFTQSVANIEPGAEINIEISYVELLQKKDGEYSFEFPMVVGPRYIPGSLPTAMGEFPPDLQRRHGVILMGPAKLGLGEQGNVDQLGTLQTGKLEALIHHAVPIKAPGSKWWTARTVNMSAEQTSAEDKKLPVAQPTLWYRFEAEYCSKAKEFGTLHTDGTGQINGRWFYTDPQVIKDMGTGFSPDTDQVPDASRITPEPVKPGKRAGHDIAIRVHLDTGGPGIVDLKSGLHEIVRTNTVKRDDGRPRKIDLELMRAKEIPNRDFVLTWKQTADTIEEATFTHTGKQGNFFTLILMPPERVEDAQAVPRELIFVLDSSGSMRGFPIEKAKEVMAKAIDALRPADTFNLITFSGDTHILWDKPRPFNKQSRDEAQQFLATRKGRGGTEMMKAINAALVQTLDGKPKSLTPAELANLPADGREVVVQLDKSHITLDRGPGRIHIRFPDDGPDDYIIYYGPEVESVISKIDSQQADSVVFYGTWNTVNGRRSLKVQRAKLTGDTSGKPIRVVCFMTDGYVGNDMAIIDAIRKNAHTTRVFSFGIGNSVNRYLLDGMARAGRGEVEYVLLKDNADEKAERFARRIQTPVLTDIEIAFSDNLKVTERIPSHIPDLFDVKPLIIHGQYTQPGSGTLTVRGNTGTGRYERTLSIDLPASQPEHDTIATLWARSKVEEVMNQNLQAAQQGGFPEALKQQVIALGEKFQIMTQFTSFVAVEKMRVTIGGKPRLVAVPIEMPDGVSYEGVFGGDAESEERLGVSMGLGGMGGMGMGAMGGGFAGGGYGGMQAKQRKGMSRSVVTAELARPERLIRRYYGTDKSLDKSPFYIASHDSLKTYVFDDVQNLSVRNLPPEEACEILRQTIDQGGNEDKSYEDRIRIEKDSVAEVVRMLELLKTNDTQAYVRRNLILERLALVIARCVRDGKLEDAKKLADAMVSFDFDFKIGVQMRDVLADESLDTAERDKQIKELAEKVRPKLDEYIRLQKLTKRLDERLYRLVNDPKLNPDDVGIKPTDKGILLSILTAKADQAMLNALQQAGLKVESTVPAVKVFIGTAARDKIAEIALLDGVRKIEPTRFD